MEKPRAAMILSAGLGLRMRPLTLTCPKPLIEINGKALLGYNLDQVETFGLDTIIVNIHHLGDQIRVYCQKRAGQKIIISDESDALLDSGGGIKKALPLLGVEPFFVLNADSFFIDGPRSNLARMSDTFDPEIMDCLLLVASGGQVTGYDGLGDFIMDQTSRLTRRPERQVAPFVYTGVALINPALFTAMPTGAFSLNRVFDRAQAAHRLFGLRLDGEWLHVGTPEAIEAAETRLQRGIY